MIDRGAERIAASHFVFDQDVSPGGYPRRESQQGDLDRRSLIRNKLSITALGHRTLEEGTYTGSGGRLGGCRAISLGDAVSAEV